MFSNSIFFLFGGGDCLPCKELLAAIAYQTQPNSDDLMSTPQKTHRSMFTCFRVTCSSVSCRFVHRESGKISPPLKNSDSKGPGKPTSVPGNNKVHLNALKTVQSYACAKYNCKLCTINTLIKIMFLLQ